MSLIKINQYMPQYIMKIKMLSNFYSNKFHFKEWMKSWHIYAIAQLESWSIFGHESIWRNPQKRKYTYEFLFVLHGWLVYEVIFSATVCT